MMLGKYYGMITEICFQFVLGEMIEKIRSYFNKGVGRCQKLCYTNICIDDF